MTDEYKTFDNQVPGEQETSTEEANQLQETQHEETRNNASGQPSDNRPAASEKKSGSGKLCDMANSMAIVSYGYVKALKQSGHTSLGNYIFQETMTLMIASNIASDSIGRDRFIANLEAGYYSSGRLIAYLNFSAAMGIEENIREALIDSVTGIHKILAASVKTAKSKQRKILTADTVNV